jgi:hypothetical protein
MAFITFNTEIINRLKTGSIKNIMLFGDSMNRPAAPYVVVKPIAGGDRKLYQIIAHMALGMQDDLGAYILRELPALLKEPLEAEGRKITARNTGAWFGPYVDDGDNNLAMSRDFYIPIIA